jgi:hypothetical protein
MCLHSHMLKLQNCMYVLTTIRGVTFQIDSFFPSIQSFPSFAHEPLLTLTLMSSESFFSQVPNVLNLKSVTFSWLLSCIIYTTEWRGVFSSKYFFQYFRMNCPCQFKHKCTVKVQARKLCSRYKGFLVPTKPSPSNFCATTFSQSCQCPYQHYKQ